MKKPAQAHVEKRHLRTRSVKLNGHTALALAVHQASTALMSITNPMYSAKKIPTPAFLRSRLIPAYDAIAKVFGPAFKIDGMEGDELFGLSIEMNPILGTFKISVNHQQINGKIQPLTAHFHAADGENLFTRILKDKGMETAESFLESI